MSATAISFYILSVLILAFGVIAVVCRRVFRSAIALLFTLIGIAGIYLLMQMEFIAALQIIVYVGGIVVLIIFSIFLTHQTNEQAPKKLLKRIIAGLTLVTTAALVCIIMFYKHTFVTSLDIQADSQIRTIGIQLLDYKSHGYALPFEAVSVLLLAALVGSIVIATKTGKKTDN